MKSRFFTATLTVLLASIVWMSQTIAASKPPAKTTSRQSQAQTNNLISQIPRQSVQPRGASFRAVPKLKSFETDFDIAYESAVYEVKLMVPQDSGRALQAIKVKQEPNVEKVHFETEAIKAVLPNGKKVSIEIPQDAKGDGQAMVVFNPPIQPGQTVTVELPVNSNPNDGIYQFGVTAVPEGQNARSQFLGFGRLHIYKR